jgi:haloalkane dehalogenase
MVHGNPTWSFYYRRLVKALSPSHRAIAVDHMGCGLSDKPDDYPYTLDQHIENLSALIKSLDVRNATLIAHDWGGAIGMGALLENRERFQRIVLCNTAAFPPPYIPWRIRACRLPIFGKLGVQGLNLFARAAVTMATSRPGGLEKNTAAGLLAPYDDWGNRKAIYAFVKDIPTRESQATWQTLSRIESQLKDLPEMKKLLLWGMKDWCFRPECLERFIQHWPEARVQAFESAGHYVIEDASDEVIEEVKQFVGLTSS